MQNIPRLTPASSIKDAISTFVRIVEQSRSANTAVSYAKGLKLYSHILNKHGLQVEKTPVDELTEDSLPWLLDELKIYSPATEQLYTSIVTRLLNFLVSEKAADINLSRMRELIRMRSRRVGQRLPQFPRTEVDQILEQILPKPITSSDETDYMRELRDRAFLVVLADTGLRVHEACNLRRGDLDWNEGRAIIIGKGNKQAVIRFSFRSMQLLKEYLAVRGKLDGMSGRPMTSLPLFARHDKGVGNKVKSITPTTGRNIVAEKVRIVLGDEAKGRITPHSFRHYFVTTVLRASGNLKLAQELARHANISVTQRYAHLSDDELDKGYFNIFDGDK
jgi:site-specific recombinase XerD